MILFIIGTRPQYVKMFPIFTYLKDNLDFILIDSGQHYDPQMSEKFANEFNMHPDFIFNESKYSGMEFFGYFVSELERFLRKNKSITKVVVFGDTLTTSAGSIVAKMMGLELFHIEAGLRSFNREMPEEINRIIADHIADKNLILSSAGKENLINEGIENQKIIEIGDLMYDSVNLVKKIMKHDARPQDNFSLLTIHRKENLSKKASIKAIFGFIEGLEHKFILPIHHSLKNAMNEFKLEIPRNVKAVNPLTYIETIKHINNSEIVLTDSGGLQKEAYYCHKPVIVLRNETEWIELIDNNYSIYFRDYKKDHKFNTDYENLYYVNTNNIQIIKDCLS